MTKVGKSPKISLKYWCPKQTRVRIEKLCKMSEIAAPTLHWMSSITHTIFKMGSGPKKLYLVHSEQKKVHSKIKKYAHPTGPAIGAKRNVHVFGVMRPTGTPEFVYSDWLSIVFLSVFSYWEALHSSTLSSIRKCGRKGRPPPPCTPHPTPYEQQHTYLPTHLRRDT